MPVGLLAAYWEEITKENQKGNIQAYMQSWKVLGGKTHSLVVVEINLLEQTTGTGPVPTRTMVSAGWSRLALVPERNSKTASEQENVRAEASGLRSGLQRAPRS